MIGLGFLAPFLNLKPKSKILALITLCLSSSKSSGILCQAVALLLQKYDENIIVLV